MCPSVVSAIGQEVIVRLYHKPIKSVPGKAPKRCPTYRVYGSKVFAVVSTRAGRQVWVQVGRCLSS